MHLLDEVFTHFEPAWLGWAWLLVLLVSLAQMFSSDQAGTAATEPIILPGSHG